MRRSVGSLVASCLVALVLPLRSPSPAAAQSWEDLELRQAVIAGIDIVVTDVFDVSQPAENHWLGRAANRLHVRTRRAVVARELLFASGETVDASRVREVERNLRRYRFIRDSRVVPVPVGHGTVQARVEVFDAWSLNGGVTLDRAGGSTSWGVRLDEGNLLGLGKRIVVGHSEDIERTSNEIGYTDPQLFRSRWTMSLGYADLSDGRSRTVRIGRPFFALDTPYAVGLDVRAADFTITQYDQGTSVYRVDTRTDHATLSAARAFRVGDHTAWRTGVTFSAERDDYSHLVEVQPSDLPGPRLGARRLHGLAWTSTILQDRPATFANLASIGRTEDHNLGWTLGGHVGMYARALGGDRRAPFLSVSARKAWRAFTEGLIVVDAAYSGRREVGQWRQTLGVVRVTAYDRTLPWQTLAAHVEATSVTRADPGQWVYLGGGDGLRGYVDHFIAGDQRVTISLDDRVITPWRPFGLVQVGFVAYADAGAIRRLDSGRWSRMYANVGAGLRFGSVKSSGGGLAQISVALPIVRHAGVERLQLVLGNAVRF